MCLSIDWLLRQDGNQFHIDMQWIKRANDWSQKARSRHLGWFFAVLSNIGITPNRLTFIRFLAAPAFMLFFATYPRKMTLVLLIASALDWFDGGLARYLKIASDRGKFWDVLVDHILYVTAVYTLLMTGAFAIGPFAYHLLLVPIVFLLATIKESEMSKTDWLIHPYYSIVYFKPLAIVALLAYVGWGINWIEPLLIVLNTIMTGVAAYHTVVLVRRWAV